MTVDEALALIEQERLDVLAEGMPEDDVNNTAAYVLASAVRKDRKFILSLQERKLSVEDSLFLSRGAHDVAERECKLQKEKIRAHETSILMGCDAMRICANLDPIHFPHDEVIQWMNNLRRELIEPYKVMSATPETDRAQFAAIPDAGRGSRFVVEADFARRLEHQRNALDDALRERDKQLIAAIAERDALLSANETLQSALRVIAESLAREDPPLQISIGYARGTALRALEEVANA